MSQDYLTHVLVNIYTLDTSNESIKKIDLIIQTVLFYNLSIDTEIWYIQWFTSWFNYMKKLSHFGFSREDWHCLDIYLGWKSFYQPSILPNQCQIVVQLFIFTCWFSEYYSVMNSSRLALPKLKIMWYNSKTCNEKNNDLILY